MDSSALLAHILSQTKQNIEFLVSQNKISSGDARDIIAKLPHDPAVDNITRSAQNLLVRSPPPPPIPQPYNPPPVTTVSKARAIWGYNEARQDPNDLSFRAGDIIEIVSEANADWWTGRRNGVEGLFPSNYVERLPPDTAIVEKAAPYNPPPAASYNNAPVYQPPLGPPAPMGYGPPPSQYNPPYPAYQPPPPQPAPTQVTTQVTVEEPKKSKFGGGDLKNTLAHSAVGGVGFGAGSAVGSGIINAIF
ncbi:SH3-domain-containing protein [Guyanagaster necrorhizus]|uniref:SH3-domain-containing protein n=1 Tax=Guyanagaster necrorhizus TaxID=856835 RepID=A0A9P7W484_9AGAR|nr:SH3-domain-containing protein [Guyanagaster necrorhizus MCA 3950]KAG7451016.1 SH3-domain-containing protein [Guyanagaster necrorhizus MCA 3950]